MTSSGIEPATLRFIAQHLNHCATAVPTKELYFLENLQPDYRPMQRNIPQEHNPQQHACRKIKTRQKILEAEENA